MKRLALILAMAVSLSATAGYKAGGPLLGKWKQLSANPNKANTLIFRSDRFFEIDLKSDGKADVIGEFDSTKKQVTLRDKAGKVSPACLNAEGVYHYTIKGNTIAFDKVKDTCLPRAEDLSMKWKKLR